MFPLDIQNMGSKNVCYEAVLEAAVGLTEDGEKPE